MITRHDFLAGMTVVVMTFIIGGVSRLLGIEKAPLRPPGGQEEARFISLCLKCDRCRSICPTDCIALADTDSGPIVARSPVLDYRLGYCDFCGLCAQVCPTQAIAAFNPFMDKIGLASIDTQVCIAYTKGNCDVCRDSCQYEALVFGFDGLPGIDSNRCNGCGECVVACKASSYTVFIGSWKSAINVENISDEQ